LSKRLIALSAVFALALVAVGCGGDDSTSTASITKAEFLTQGNAICDKGNKEINTAFESFAKENNLEQNQNLTDAQATEASNTILIPNVQSQVDQIRELGAPAGQETQVDAILTAAQQGIDDLKDDPTLLAQSNADPFAEANKLARDYGLTACAG
jgi:hypothetical protein